MSAEAPAVWAITTGEAGMISQAAGLAEAVGLPWVLKTVSLRAPWRWLPGHLCPAPLAGLSAGSDAIAPPWPRLVITCGRRSVAVALEIKRRSAGKTVCVHIQDPRVPSRLFDVVAAPRHDGLSGPNVIATRGALHRVKPEKIAAAATTWAPRLAHLPRPLVGVLIGGTSKAYCLTPAIMADVAAKLAALARTQGAGLMVTASRRTGAENEAVLRASLAGLPAFVWDGQGENPYLGILGLADHLVVTADSVSMVSEACSTGKPVQVIDLDGGNARFARFHADLRAEGATRAFDGTLCPAAYAPVNDTQAVATVLRARLGLEAQG